MTFPAVEQAVSSRLREHIAHTAETINAEEVRAIASRRQAGHWASPRVSKTGHLGLIFLARNLGAKLPSLSMAFS
jgi:hypothetical protein